MSDFLIKINKVKNSFNITIAGNNVGTTIVTASDGEKTISVKVIVTEDITLWKGPYGYNPPKTNYRYTVSESDGDKYSYAFSGYGKQSVITAYEVKYMEWTRDLMPIPSESWKPYYN